MRNCSRYFSEDLPYINLWYFDNVLVHSRRVHGMKLDPSGSYDFPENGHTAIAG